MTGSYYAFAGKKEGLTDADVAKVAPRVKDLERSIVHYGDSTLFIEDQLCKGGLAYASAVAMEETTVIDFNRRRCSNTKLVALYPAGGLVLQRLALHRAQRRLGDAGRTPGRGRLPEVPGR